MWIRIHDLYTDPAKNYGSHRFRVCNMVNALRFISVKDNLIKNSHVSLLLNRLNWYVPPMVYMTKIHLITARLVCSFLLTMQLKTVSWQYSFIEKLNLLKNCISFSNDRFFIFTVKTNYIPYAKFHVFIKELYFTR